MNKPPLGLRPKHIADLQRLQEIDEAIKRYLEAKYQIPEEWVEERAELLKSLKRRNLINNMY